MAQSRCELLLRRPVGDLLLAAIRNRFDHVSAQGTLLTVDGVDQASVRALLDHLWDAGHEIRSVVVREVP